MRCRRSNLLSILYIGSSLLQSTQNTNRLGCYIFKRNPFAENKNVFKEACRMKGAVKTSGNEFIV